MNSSGMNGVIFQMQRDCAGGWTCTESFKPTPRIQFKLYWYKPWQWPRVFWNRMRRRDLYKMWRDYMRTAKRP